MVQALRRMKPLRGDNYLGGVRKAAVGGLEGLLHEDRDPVAQFLIRIHRTTSCPILETFFIDILI